MHSRRYILRCEVAVNKEFQRRTTGSIPFSLIEQLLHFLKEQRQLELQILQNRTK